MRSACRARQGTDLYSVVKAEFIAMRLADISGLNIAPVNLLSRLRLKLTGAAASTAPVCGALLLIDLDRFVQRRVKKRPGVDDVVVVYIL